jgi:hypothetical protein
LIVSTVRKTWRPFAPWARRPRAGQRSPRPRPRLEELETRNVLSGSWTLLNSFAPGSTGTMMLLTDGTVMAQAGGITNQWFQLSPDASGGYVNGTWSTLASMRATRLYMASNVLNDGRVMVLGGEYSSDGSITRTGEIYDPTSNSWSAMTPFPLGSFGDDPSSMLPDGRVLLGYIFDGRTFAYDPTSNTYTQTATKQFNDRSDEEGFVQLPDQSILSYDVFAEPHAQRYFPSQDQWVNTGDVPVHLSGSTVGEELGPGFMLPDGRALFFGANGNIAFYDPNSNTWTAGTPIPNGLGADDAPGAMMPNGHILIAADRPLFNGPTKVFEFDPTGNGGSGSYTDVTPSNILNLNGPSYVTRMLMLPSGQVLFTNGGNRLAVYTPNEPPDPSWQPNIDSYNDNGDGTFTLFGEQLTGISEGAAYGDDAEMASNYPIVQLTANDGSGVFYARTTSWSYTGISPVGDTNQENVAFTPPAGLPANDYSLVVIANGIPSNPVDFPYGLGPVTGGGPAAVKGVSVAPAVALSGPVLPAPSAAGVAEVSLPATGTAGPTFTQVDTTAGGVGAQGADLALPAGALAPANAGTGALVPAAPATGGAGGVGWDSQAFGFQGRSLTALADPGGSSASSASQDGGSTQALDAVFQQGLVGDLT